MVRALSLFTLAALVAAGCDSSNDSVPVDGELLLSALSAQEEELRAGFDDLHSDPLATPVDQPPLQRDCSTEATLAELVARYDGDGDGRVAPEEEGAVWQAREERSDSGWERQERRWHLLELVYDLDEDGAITGAEREALLADFDARCEARQAQVLEEFDLDGSGALDDEELAAARDAMQARRAERASACQNSGGDMGPPDEGQPQDGMGPPQDGMGPPRGGPQDRLLAAWDADGDGALSASELELLRSTMRDRIASGAPIRPDAGA